MKKFKKERGKNDASMPMTEAGTRSQIRRPIKLTSGKSVNERVV